MLLDQYARLNSEEAFAEIVSRYINMVYSVALRHIHDAHQAEEITQAVFVILAQKAGSLNPQTILPGWLCRTARHVSTRAVIMQQRRQRREQEASYMQSISTEPDAEAWKQIAPLLDSALGQLGGKDHDAIVLRFFDGKSFKEVGAALGASEDTAKKRVNRTLEKLRRFFTKRGVTLSVTAIAGVVASNAVQAAPVGMAKSVAAVAAAKGTGAAASTVALLKGTLRFMAWAKLKTAAGLALAVLLAAGATTATVKTISRQRENDVWAALAEAYRTQRWAPLSPFTNVVALRPSKLGNNEGFGGDANAMVGMAMPASGLFGHAYGINRTRIANSQSLPKQRYDFVACCPNAEEALQNEIKKQLGLVGKKEVRRTNVLVLTVANAGAPGLKPAGSDHSGDPSDALAANNMSIHDLAYGIERRLRVPVLDQTGMTNKYDIRFRWNEFSRKPDALQKAMREQLGLELTPTNDFIEMLVVKKTD